jgi:hypothetical protein
MSAETYQMDALFDVPPEVTWLRPVDQYGRDLPPIVILDSDWQAAFGWGLVATAAANALGLDVTLDELFTATTTARHTYYALTGDRTRLELEFNHYKGKA